MTTANAQWSSVGVHCKTGLLGTHLEHTLSSCLLYHVLGLSNLTVLGTCSPSRVPSSKHPWYIPKVRRMVKAFVPV
jgi:hypothetical protein